MKPRRPTIKDSTQHLNSEGRKRKSQQVAARAARKAAKKARQEAEAAARREDLNQATVGIVREATED
jgi:hypothetical protein